jgi:GntR family transcriptional regulator, rspAB operon transcriptional repressor
MPLQKQPPARESDRVEVELRHQILTLELEPGLAVSEATLIKHYGWGRTPLREAFQRLAEQSLLQIIPRQGVVITALSVFDFVEMMDAMGIVIGPAAMLACKHLRAEELDQLAELVSKGEAAAVNQDFITVTQIDYEFHRILAESTGNRYLSRYLLHLHQVATRFNFAAWKRDNSASESIAEHKQLVNILRQRDTAQAKAAMLAHIENGRQRVLGALAIHT